MVSHRRHHRRHARSKTRRALRARPETHISDVGLINFLHRSLPECALLGYLALIAYCSLLPFGTFESQVERVMDKLHWTGLATWSGGLKDILPNIMLYVPLGVGSYIVARRSGWGTVAAFVSGVSLSAGASVVLELLQQLVPERVSSWVDIVSNTAGGFIGVALGRFAHPVFRGMVDRAHYELKYMPLSTSLRAYVMVLFVAGVVPLDFTYDASRVALAMRQARVVPFGDFTDQQVHDAHVILGEGASGALVRRRMVADFGLDMVAEAASFGLLGVLFGMMCRREMKSGRLDGWLFSAFSCTFLAAGLSCVQFFIISRGFDASAIVVRSLAACACAAFAVILMPRRRSQPPTPETFGPQGFSRRAAGWLTFGVVLYAIARGLSPFMGFSDDPMYQYTPREFGLFPLARYFLARFPVSAEDIIYKTLRYVVLGVMAALAVGLRPRGSFQLRAIRITLWAVGLSLAIECSQLFIPTRWPDITHIMLAAFGTYAGVLGTRWVNDVYRHIRAGVVFRDQRLAEQIATGQDTSPIFNVELPPPDADAPKEVVPPKLRLSSRINDED